jgi:RNA polymerase sigma-B factor
MSVLPDPRSDQQELDNLFDRLAVWPHDHPTSAAARRRLVEHYLPMAARLAQHYRYKGVGTDDLVQVARTALVGAADRFDPKRRVEFVAFAATTIHGELKKHFRDTAWTIRVPRTIQERCLAVSAVTAERVGRTGVEPTVAELADILGTSPALVKEAVHAAAGYRAVPFGASDDDRDEPVDPSSTAESVEARERWRLVSSLIRQLPERDRRVIYLRYFDDLSQAEIAAQVGVSQMHVSRILSRTLERLSAEVGSHGRVAS